eukprot:jgi/Picsp_1/6550/NSC_03893-R1_---NA---
MTGDSARPTSGWTYEFACLFEKSMALIRISRRGSEPRDALSPKLGGLEPSLHALHSQGKSGNGNHEANDTDTDKKSFVSKDNLEAILPENEERTKDGKVNEEEEVAALLYDMARTNSGEDRAKLGKRPADPAPRSEKRSRRSTRARKPEIYNDYASDFEDFDVEADYVARRTDSRKPSKSTLPENRLVNGAEQGLHTQAAPEMYFNHNKKGINQMAIARFIEWSLNLGVQQQYIERGFMPPGSTSGIHASISGSFAPLSPHIPGRALINQNNMEPMQYGAYGAVMGGSRFGLQESNQMNNYGSLPDPTVANQQAQQYASHATAEVARVIKGLLGSHFGDRQLPSQGYGGQTMHGAAGAIANAGFRPAVQHTEHSPRPPGVRAESGEASLGASKNTPSKIAEALKELLAHNMGDQKDFTLGAQSINRTADLESSRRQNLERTQMESSRHSISGLNRPFTNEVAAVAVSMPQGHMEANNNESGARNFDRIHQTQELQYLDRIHSLLRNFSGSLPDFGPQNTSPRNK